MMKSSNSIVASSVSKSSDSADSSNSTAGFSLLELIIVISISMMLGAISLSTFFSVSEQQSLEKDVQYTIALVEKARLQTVNAKSNSQFGVRFASSSVTLFQGSTYTAGSATNTVFTLSPKVEISSINLSAGTQNLAFELITGKSNATGTVQFRLKNNQNSSTTIVVYKTGLVETQ